MIPYMKGGGEDRKLRFCIGAKVCSGKSKDEAEAQKLCAEAALQPKAPRKARGKCKIDIAALATCIIKSLDGTEISQAKLAPIIASCTGQKAEKTGRENFIKRCFKENASSGDGRYDMKEAEKLRSLCTARYKAQIQDAQYELGVLQEGA